MKLERGNDSQFGPSMFFEVGAEKPPPSTLPETNIAHENPTFPGKYHQNGGFSMAMLVSGSVMRCNMM